MIINQVISTTDLHVAGEPLRTICYNPLFERRETMKAYQEDIDHFDFIPTLLKEPRGHSGMNLCVITPPISSKAKCGLLFRSVNGNVPLMEHGLIGAATVLCEADNFRGNEIIFDCLNGQVKVHIDYDTRYEQVKSISYFQQIHYSDQSLLLDTYTIDVIKSFQTIAILNLRQLELTLSISELNEIKRISQHLFKVINNFQLSDPINHLIFFSVGEEGQPVFLCIDRFGHIDRSPYSGAGAITAYLFKKGLSRVNQMNRVQNFLNHSIETCITISNDKRDELITEIKGKAFITGLHQFAVNPIDPLKDGFLLK